MTFRCSGYYLPKRNLKLPSLRIMKGKPTRRGWGGTEPARCPGGISGRTREEGRAGPDVHSSDPRWGTHSAAGSWTQKVKPSSDLAFILPCTLSSFLLHMYIFLPNVRHSVVWDIPKLNIKALWFMTFSTSLFTTALWSTCANTDPLLHCFPPPPPTNGLRMYINNLFLCFPEY